jgi:hypothetical protein
MEATNGFSRVQAAQKMTCLCTGNMQSFSPLQAPTSYKHTPPAGLKIRKVGGGTASQEEKNTASANLETSW